MKTSLMLGAVALFLSAVSASAFPPSTKYTIKLDNMSDTFVVSKTGQLYADVHYFQVGTRTAESGGVGMATTTGYVGKGFILTDVQENPGGTKFVCYNFSNPRKRAGEWYAYYSYDGVHVHPGGWGTYTVVSVSVP